MMFEENGNIIDINQEYLHPGLGPIDDLPHYSSIDMDQLIDEKDYYNMFQLAHLLYAPSYVSFSSVLSMWSIIPEYAYHVSCATLLKGDFVITVDEHSKSRSYYFQTVPSEVFLMYVNTWYNEDGSVYCHLATREKAVCDQLYRLPDMGDVDELKILMFEDQRFDDEDIDALDKKVISDLADHYGSKNVTLLDEYLGAIR
jgi:hypothetical protein